MRSFLLFTMIALLGSAAPLAHGSTVRLARVGLYGPESVAVVQDVLGKVPGIARVQCDLERQTIFFFAQTDVAQEAAQDALQAVGLIEA